VLAPRSVASRGRHFNSLLEANKKLKQITPKSAEPHALVWPSQGLLLWLSGSYTLNSSLREIVTWEDTMNLMHVFVASTAFLILGSGAAKADRPSTWRGLVSMSAYDP